MPVPSRELKQMLSVESAALKIALSEARDGARVRSLRLRRCWTLLWLISGNRIDIRRPVVSQTMMHFEHAQRIDQIAISSISSIRAIWATCGQRVIFLIAPKASICLQIEKRLATANWIALANFSAYQNVHLAIFITPRIVFWSQVNRPTVSTHESHSSGTSHCQSSRPNRAIAQRSLTWAKRFIHIQVIELLVWHGAARTKVRKNSYYCARARHSALVVFPVATSSSWCRRSSKPLSPVSCSVMCIRNANQSSAVQMRENLPKKTLNRKQRQWNAVRGIFTIHCRWLNARARSRLEAMPRPLPLTHCECTFPLFSNIRGEYTRRLYPFVNRFLVFTLICFFFRPSVISMRRRDVRITTTEIYV